MAALPPVLELARELVAFDTINPPGREEDCAAYLGALLESAGLAVRRFEFAHGRTSLIAELSGSGERPPLCFTGHIDTVPLGAQPWTRAPFGEIAQGRLYGRGSSDMKAGVAAFVHAACQLARRRGRSGGLVLVITAGEETGCEGASDLVKRGVLGKAGAVIVAEPSANYPYVGHKGALWLKGRARGKTAHGSMPERGDNAVYKAARAVLKLADYHFNLAPHALLGRATLNIGTISGGLNINSVPDAADFTVDIRTVPGQAHGRARESLQSYLGSDIALETLVDVPAIASDDRHPWVQEVFGLMAGYLSENPRPRGATYFTDAAYLTPAYGAPPTVILGPGEPELAHQTDEYCVIAKLEQAAQAFEAIGARWCGA